MQVAVVASPRSPHQQEHQRALAEGLRALGIDALPVATGHGRRGQTVACWGWRQGVHLRARGCEVLVMERGYLGDRFAWTSLAWNGLNGRAQFAPDPQDPSRFDKHFTLKPWRSGGEYVLILGQVPGDASLQGRSLDPWYASAAAEAAQAYGLPVQFRPHPQAAKRGQIARPAGTTRSEGSLDEALQGAAVAIAFNSNSTVDAVIAGVPAVAVDPGSMAWDVVGHNIGDLVRPDRRAWASALAWRQWTIDEIKSGEALRGLFT